MFHSCRCRRCRRWRGSARSVGWVVSWVCGGSVCGFVVGESLSLLPPTVLLTDDVGCLAGGGSFEALDGELALVAGAGGSSSSSSAHPSAIVCICEGGRTCCIIVEQSIASCRSSSHACNYNASCTCKSGAAAVRISLSHLVLSKFNKQNKKNKFQNKMIIHLIQQSYQK